MNTELPRPISDQSTICTRRFHLIRDAIQSHEHLELQLPHSLVSDELERFRMWAGNIGAIYMPGRQDSSLDLRLLKAPRIADQVLEFVVALARDLDAVWQIASGKRPNRTGTLETYEEPLEEDALEGTTELLEVSEILELFETCQNFVSCLFRLSVAIRKATKRDRYAASMRKREDPYDERFDINHVGHKFPKVHGVPWLERRLGRAITRRREFIRYSKEHHKRLAKGEEKIQEEQVRQIITEEPLNNHQEPATLLSLTNSTNREKSTIGSTKATTLDVAQIRPLEDVIIEETSDSSYATTSITAENEGDLRVPPIPEYGERGKDFVCPYCQTVQCFKGKKARKQWKEHVLQDLRPYVCTFPACNMLMFSDSDAWFKHELDEHRLQWACQFCAHQPMDTVEEYESHLGARHEASVKSLHLPALLKASQQPQVAIPPSSCPFCDPEVEDENLPLDAFKFQIHVAKHMRQLALFALPRVSDVGEDSWESTRPAMADPDTAENFGEADQPNNEPKDPPLHVAAFEGRGVDIKRMLQAGHDIDASGSTWGSVLGAAIAGGHRAVVKLLVDCGADLHLQCSVQDISSGTAFQAAAAMKDPVLEKILLDAEARNDRPRTYGELSWKLESAATNFERLISTYTQNQQNFMIHDDGLGAMETMSSSSKAISESLRLIGAELDPGSENQASQLEPIMSFVPNLISGLEDLYDLIHIVFVYFHYDCTETGQLQHAAYQSLSRFTFPVLRIILKGINGVSLTEFLVGECEPLLKRLADGLKKATARSLTRLILSDMIEGSSNVQTFIATLHRAVREQISSMESSREDRLHYFNTYPFEPEVFYKHKAAGLLDEYSTPYESSERALVEKNIPAIVRGSAYEILDLKKHTQHAATSSMPDQQDLSSATNSNAAQSSNYNESITPLTSEDDESQLGLRNFTSDATTSIPSRVTSAASSDVSDAEAATPRQSTSAAVVDFVRRISALLMLLLTGMAIFMTQVSTSGKLLMHKVSHLAQIRKPLSAEEQIKPLIDTFVDCQAGLDRLQEFIIDFRRHVSTPQPPQNTQMDRLLALCRTSRERLELIKNHPKLIPEHDKTEPVYTSDINDPEQMAELRQPVVFLDVALDILREPQTKSSGQGMQLSWIDLMAHFEWRAGWSLQEMLEAYSKICEFVDDAGDLLRHADQEENDARNRLTEMLDRQRLFD